MALADPVAYTTNVPKRVKIVANNLQRIITSIRSINTLKRVNTTGYWSAIGVQIVADSVIATIRCYQWPAAILSHHHLAVTVNTII